MIASIFAWWFRIKGWKVEGNFPSSIHRCIVIAAPHTSNWDFVFTLGCLHMLKVQLNYLAKKELFRWPLSLLLKNTGAIPVERKKSQGLVDTIIHKFAENEQLILMVPAEGTRSYVNKWKTGFYYAALGAGVPLVMGYLDYEKKTAGFGPVLHLTGDKIKDGNAIKAFYADKKGKFPQLFHLEGLQL